MNIREMLSGKKTYMIAIAAILGVVMAWGSGDMTAVEAIQSGVGAMLAMTMRAGIAK
ncbi:hypothetical protein KAR91_11070 [Candidatus Pacearchaeota archaeon]|nr:hypothetical protein [Candidatus Pacearchaeota archaeon]